MDVITDVGIAAQYAGTLALYLQENRASLMENPDDRLQRRLEYLCKLSAEIFILGKFDICGGSKNPEEKPLP